MNTFEITIQRAQDGGWPVVVRHQQGPIALTTWANGLFDLDLRQLDLLLPADRLYGELLGQHIFQADIRDAFVRAFSGAKAASELLRVLLIVEADDLRSRHWEQLCAPFEGGRWDYLLLNQQTPFSLYLPSQIERRFPPIGRRDLRALLLVSGPEELAGDYGLAPFDASVTVAALAASFGEIPCDVLANSAERSVGEPNLTVLCDLLTAQHYTFLFIVSHGAYRQKDGETILYFPENENRRPVTGSMLIEHLSRLDSVHGLPHFTFLSTCESAYPQAENGLGGLGQRLVRELGMPAVLAMTDRVSIQTAQALSGALCTRLAEHGEVDRALAEALVSLQGRYDVTVPALFSRLGGQPLYSDALDRPLTTAEIHYGLEQLGDLLKERAPVLTDEFKSHSTKIRDFLDTDPDALGQEARRERDTSLAEANQLTIQALDISFNALALGQKPPQYDARSPFRGLYPFRAEDREFFFGRQELIDDLTGRLNKHNLLVVLGPSGCGKSSLVLAGLVPALNVPLAYMTPGNDPFEQLKSTLEEAHPEGVLVVDQFEELFTLCTDENQRQVFLERLLYMAGKMRVVITMRADFLGDCAAYPELRSAIEAHQALIGPMSATELRRTTELQADYVGLRFEAGLSEQILDDVQGEPGAMPLLQHALLLLWQRRHGRWLRWEEYTAIGGIRKAIAHTAEEVYAGLGGDEKARIRDIFIRLTRLPEMERSAEGTPFTRRRVSLEELVPAGSDRAATILLVKRLADARLLVTRQPETTNDVEVEVAHEALIQHWPRLRTWLEENRADILLREALTQAAREWESLARDSDALYRGARLAQAGEWEEDHPSELNLLEQDFLFASRELMQREEAARQRRLKLTLTIALLVAVLMTALGIFGLNSSREASFNLGELEIKSTDVAKLEEEARVQFLFAKGQLEYEEQPLLGLRLMMEAWKLAGDDEETRETILKKIQAEAHKGRLFKLGNHVEGLYALPSSPNYVIDYRDQNDIFFQSDLGQVRALSGEVNGVISATMGLFSPAFIINYDGVLPELRSTSTGETLDQMVGEVYWAEYTPNGAFIRLQAYIVDANYGVDELRRTEDGALIFSEYVEFSPTGAYIFSEGSHSPVFDGETGELIDYLSDSGVDYFSRNETYYIVDDQLRQTSTGDLIKTFPGQVLSVHFNSDDTLVVVAMRTGENEFETRFYNLETGENFSLTTCCVDGVYFSPDGSSFVVDYESDMGSDELRHTADGEFERVLCIPGATCESQVTYSPEGNALLVEYSSDYDPLYPPVVGTSSGKDIYEIYDSEFGWVNFTNCHPLFDNVYDCNIWEGSYETDLTYISSDFSFIIFYIPGDCPEYRASWMETNQGFSATGPPYIEKRGGVGCPSFVESEILDGLNLNPVDYFYMDYYLGGKLFDTDNSIQIPPYFSPHGSFYFISSTSKPYAELRRSYTNELLAYFEREIVAIDFSPDESFFIVTDSSGQSELWTTLGAAQRLASLSDNLQAHYFDLINDYLVVWYKDGSAYLLDLDWLTDLNGDPSALSPDNLMAIICQDPLQSPYFDAAELASLLNNRQPEACGD